MSGNKHRRVRNGTEVYVKSMNDNDYEFATKKFNKKVQKAKIIKAYQEKAFHEKPCDKKNRKMRETIIRLKKEEERRRIEIAMARKNLFKKHKKKNVDKKNKM